MSIDRALVDAALAAIADPNTQKPFAAAKNFRNVSVDGATVSVDVVLGYPARRQFEAIRAQVEQAYLHAWDVWADALLRLDTSRLPDVLTGNALDKITAQVDTQRDKNQPVRISVEHDYTITLSSDSKATVDDNYVNHNVRLDPKTMEPIEDDPNDRVRLTFAMTRVGGTWKISEIIGFE